MTDSKPFNIAIVGGGIGGLCLAIALQKHGIPFHIYEAAAAFAEIGAGVSLNGMAQQAMRLIHPDLIAGFDRQATGNATQVDTFFQFRWGMDGRGINAGRRAGDYISELTHPTVAISSVHRAHFLDELVRLVPADRASFGHRVARVDDQGDHVMLHFEHGASARASAVVGCDGIKSHVRDSLLGPEYRARFSGKHAYRGLVDMDQAAALLGDATARNSQMHLGYGGHMLTMPIEKGRTMNVVCFRSKADGRWDDERWVLPMDHAAMDADFADWGSNVKKVLSLMQKPDVWAIFNHPPAPTFYKNRVVLMGDAAHASTPHLGSGAGFAIADAYVLGELLSSVQSSDQLPAAFAAFDEVRRPIDLKLVEKSYEAGITYDLEDPRIGDDETKFDRWLQTMLDWVVQQDLQDQVARTRQLLNTSRL